MESSKHSNSSDSMLMTQTGIPYLGPTRAGAFLGLVRAGAEISRELNRSLEGKHGLSLQAFEVLLYLTVFSEDGSLPMKYLTEHAPLSQSRVSRLVSELEQRGYVERRDQVGDRRGVEVAITPEGSAKFAAAQESHLADLETRLFNRLSDAEVKQLARITRKLLSEDE